MVVVRYNERPEKVKYMPIPESKKADIRLRTEISEVQEEDFEGWEAKEHYFRAEMSKEYVEQHFSELLDYTPDETPEETTENLLLEMAADHEYRLCLIELGVTL